MDELYASYGWLMFIALIIVGGLAASYVVGWGLEVLWKRLRKIKE